VLFRAVKSNTIRHEVEKSYPRAKLVLQKIPFVLPHKDRVILFRTFVAADKSKLGEWFCFSPLLKTLEKIGFKSFISVLIHTLQGQPKNLVLNAPAIVFFESAPFKEKRKVAKTKNQTFHSTCRFTPKLVTCWGCPSPRHSAKATHLLA